MTNRIENTNKTENRPDWLFGGNPGAIEQQEHEGQMRLCASSDAAVRASETASGLAEAADRSFDVERAGRRQR